MVEDVLNGLAKLRTRTARWCRESRRRSRAVDSGAVTVIDDREEGQSAAALLGLARVRELGCERAMLVPGDCPLIDGRELRDLAMRASPWTWWSSPIVTGPARTGWRSR